MDPPCTFCRIVAREAEASIAYEDADVLAFMDLRAFHPGHTLVIPKAHIVDICALDDDAVSRSLMNALSRVARAVRSAFAPDGLSVWQSNGEAAGQEVFHLHFHIVPRSQDDGMLRVYPARVTAATRADLDEHAARIRDAIDAT